jgi:hypothetical protein
VSDTVGRPSVFMFGAILVVAAVLVLGVYFSGAINGNSTTTQSTSTTSAIEGVVTGYVTAGPSQPICTAGQSCDENMSGYNLVFVPLCSGSAGCETSMAPLSFSGHYSALLPAGTYTVTGLSPSCPWVGCSTAFPVQVVVVGGSQLVLNFEINTGIA